MTVQDLLRDVSKKTKIEYNQVDNTVKKMVAVMNDGEYSTVGKITKMLRSLKKKKDVIKISKQTTEETGYPYEEVFPVVEYMLDIMKKTLSTGGIPAIMKMVKEMKENKKLEKKQKKSD